MELHRVIYTVDFSFFFTQHNRLLKRQKPCVCVCVYSTHTNTNIHTLIRTHAHKHTHAEGGAQLRAATAGACCWSEDWSCRPRYSLWTRGTVTLDTATQRKTGWIGGEGLHIGGLGGWAGVSLLKRVRTDRLLLSELGFISPCILSQI